MNYDSDNKIWRVGGPLLSYLGIRLLVESAFYIGIWYIQFREFDVTAAFNGITYVEQFGVNIKLYSLMMSGVAMAITIPVMLYLMKKDYEYPVNIRKKERSFVLGEYVKDININEWKLPVMSGIMGAAGLSRLISLFPIDGVLGDYSQIKQSYSESTMVMQIVVLCILSPVVEELLFRGLIYNRLKGYYEVTIAAYISSIIFGIAHFNLVQGLYAFIMGIVFSYVYEKYRNIIAPIMMHAAANITTVFMWSNPVSQFIDKYKIVCFIVALAETVIFVALIIRMYRHNKIK